MKNRAIKKAKRRNLGSEVIKMLFLRLLQSVCGYCISLLIIQPLSTDNVQ